MNISKTGAAIAALVILAAAHAVASGYQKRSLLEEYTGTWCGYCTRGYASIEYIRENHPDMVCVSYHYDDPMQSTINYPQGHKNSYPWASVDRREGGDPYEFGGTGDITNYTMAEHMLSADSEDTDWRIEVSQHWSDDDPGRLVVEAEVKCSEDVDGADYLIGYILVCDGLMDDVWMQANYFSTVAPTASVIPQMRDFCMGGVYGSGYVRNLVYNNVVVSAKYARGVKGSIPAGMAAGAPSRHSVDFNVYAFKRYGDSSIPLVTDKGNVWVVAMVIDGGTGYVLNCAKTQPDNMTAGVSISDRCEDGVEKEYYTLSGVRVTNPTEGIYICREGSKARKMIVRSFDVLDHD